MRVKINKGFTLVEILVAIAIIATAAVIGIPNIKKFSNDQQITDVRSEIIRSLRQAQSSAMSGTKCSNSIPALEWRLSLQQDQLTLSGSCKNLRVSDINLINASPTADSRPVFNFPPTIKVVESGCGSEADSRVVIIFNKQGVSFSCITNPDLAITGGIFTITLQNTAIISQKKCIKISRGGAIYEADPDVSSNICTTTAP